MNKFKEISAAQLAPHKARFDRNLLKAGECWEWRLAIKNTGYGSFRISKELGCMNAHKAAWILSKGDVPDGLYVCHKCDNKKCCRPDHLWLGTPKQNQQDMGRKGRAVSYARGNAAVQRDSFGRFKGK